MKLGEFNGRHAGQRIIIVADGLSCPIIEKTPDNVIIAVNHGYHQVDGRPDYLVFNDSNWLKEFRQSETIPLHQIAGVVFHGHNAHPETHDNVVSFRTKAIWSRKLQDGVYGIQSSGLSALTFAICMGAKVVDLYGYDYRVFTDREAMNLFKKQPGTHASSAAHRQVKNKIYITKVRHFEIFVRQNVEIINHSMYSNIPYFKRER